MPRDLYDEFEYDVALSFAREDRGTAEELARHLAAKKIKVFSDELESARSPDQDMLLHLAELFRVKARYCVLFISRSYPLETWTEADRTAAEEHAIRDANAYFLLLHLDDRELPGLNETAGYRDLRQHSMESIATALQQKLAQTKGRSTPATQSHDLRSGNIASKQRKP